MDETLFFNIPNNQMDGYLREEKEFLVWVYHAKIHQQSK